MGNPKGGSFSSVNTFLGVLGCQYTTHIRNTRFVVLMDAIADARHRARNLEGKEALDHEINGPQQELREMTEDVLDDEKGLKEGRNSDQHSK